MLLLRRQLTAAGIGQAEEPVRVQDLGRYDGMILCNSRGWAPVGRVDDLVVPQDAGIHRRHRSRNRELPMG